MQQPENSRQPDNMIMREGIPMESDMFPELEHNNDVGAERQSYAAVDDA